MGLILRCASISILSSLLFHSPAGGEGILFRVSRDVSPLAGRVTFFCIRQKKVTKEKASPKVTVAARLPCDARDLGPVHKLAPYCRSNIWTGNLPRPLRFSASPTGPKVKGKGKVKIKTNRRNAAVWPLTCLPFGAAEERRRSGGLPALMFEPRSGEFKGRPTLPSTTGNPEGAVPWGVLFFGYFILHEQKKVTRSPQGSETTR